MEYVRVGMELVALVIALVALVVSYLTLYTTVWRPAEISMDYLQRGGELPLTLGDLREQPTMVYITVFISNTGAKGGVVDDVQVTEVEPIGSLPDAPYWVGIANSGLYPERSAHVPPVGPLALEAGDVKTAFVVARLQRAAVEPEEEARRIGATSAISILVEYTVFRTVTAWPWHLFPLVGRQHRERKTRTLKVEISAAEYRAGCIAWWQRLKSTQYLAEIAEGG